MSEDQFETEVMSEMEIMEHAYDFFKELKYPGNFNDFIIDAKLLIKQRGEQNELNRKKQK